MTDALSRGVRGAGATVVGQALKVLLQFVTVITLSRLLTPEDFGLVAMVTVFVSFGETIRDFGMTLIGLQRKALTHQEASNLFWLNTALGLLTAVGLTASAGLLVTVYGESRLWWVVPGVAPILLINGMAAQIRVQLARSMRFLLIATVDVGSQIVMLATAVTLATRGAAYWALIASNLAAAIFGLVLPWIATQWTPTRPRPDDTSRQLVRDGAAFGIAQFLTYLANNVDTLIIGMRWDPISVGLYNRGYQLLTLPIQQLMGPLTQVVIPTVHAAVDEGHTTDSVLMRVQFGLGLIVIWIFAVTAAIADWLIPFLLGDGWRPSVPIFQALAFGGFFWTFSQVNYWRVIVDNHGRQLVRLNLVTKAIAIAMILIGSTIGLQAVAWAVAISLAITWPIALIWYRRVARWDSWRQFANGMRIMIPGVVAMACGLALVQRSGESVSLSIAMGGALVVTAVYLTGILAVPGGPRETRAALNLVRRLVPRH